MQKFHVKKGDEVVVIAGSELGKRGKIINVQTKKQRVIVEGLKMIKKHVKKNQAQPQGAIIEREGSIHISNVMLAANFDKRSSKTATPAATK
ncbi:MAG: ribosomal protein [Verrucomicrobiales bacterium]|nr:ribosomal protein [Verrucomicrobiales bacterium]